MSVTDKTDPLLPSCACYMEVGVPRSAHPLPALPESTSLALGAIVAASEVHAALGSTSIIGASSS